MGSWVCSECGGSKRNYDSLLCRACYRDPVLRFWRKVDRKGEDCCWLWTAGVDKDGYGVYGFAAGRNLRAHRYAYELEIDPLASDQVLDHLCRTPACCNPNHLEPVTVRENVLRGKGPAARNARKTHCPKGHPYSGVNLEVKKSGARRCKRCRQEAEGAAREAARG